MSDPLLEQFQHHLQELAFAFGAPQAKGRLRCSPTDFKVWEQLSFTPSGDGEHWFFQIEKTGLNTEEVVSHLANQLKVSKVDIGYAGLKDKHAVTTQWFSVKLAGRDVPAAAQIDTDQLQVQQMLRNQRKLKTGAIAQNRFEIRVNELQGDREWICERVNTIRERGVPNYFGEQRFGHNGQNLFRAREMLQGRKVKSRHLRGLYYSAIRSFLFNRVLSHRVEQRCWNQALPGDAMSLDGSRSSFIAEHIDTEIERRLTEFDIHPSGPLPGTCGKSGLASGQAAELEQAILEPYQELCSQLQASGLSQQRRALRLVVPDIELSLQDDVLQLAFSLPSGAYATTVLRELVS
ncbi:MAG: tRNA pseudouridine(13) synthase TruD [Gammaproteobacteria bacterium]|nr:tRNA pseudouridine(13) synthase TruD [Gammaproteobacteria bacterium]MDH5803346.1 tRNA pseudouridine(13) synthase TruD [Gammaproteobacteria bacterium]